MQVDKKLEDALRHTVKRSLQELSRILNGDAKTEVLPVFRVTMVLEKSNRVELRPTIQHLFDMVHKVSRDLITVIQNVPRLALQLTERQKKELEVRTVPSRHILVACDGCWMPLAGTVNFYTVALCCY